jgi:glycosyltransferase involved in cell wall biosynthesis
MCWVIGTIARKWAAALRQHECAVISHAYLTSYPKRFEAAASAADVIVALSWSYFEELRRKTRAATVCGVHHALDEAPAAAAAGADRVFAVSREWVRWLTQRLADADKVKLIHSGVDVQAFVRVPPTAQTALRMRNGLVREDFVVGFLAKDTEGERKGSDIFVAAVAEAGKHIPNLAVLTAGPQRSTLQNALESAGVKVIRVGYVIDPERMPDLYNMLDAYVISSRIEGGPVTLLEAMSCGVPVVTTPVGLALDAVRDRENGLVVPKDNPAALTAALLELAVSATLREKLGQAGRDGVVREFSWESSLRGVPELCTGAVAAWRKRTGAGPDVLPSDGCGGSAWRPPAVEEVYWHDLCDWGMNLCEWDENTAARAVARRVLLQSPFKIKSWRLWAAAHKDKWHGQVLLTSKRLIRNERS